MILFLDTQGLLLSARNGCMRVIHGEIDKLIGLNKITSIVVSSKIQIDSVALALCFKSDIPIYFTDKFGAVVGVSRKIGFSLASQIRREQVLFIQKKEAIKWVKDIHVLKLKGQLANMKFALDRKTKGQKHRLKKLKEFELILNSISGLKSKNMDTLRPSLLGKEGAAARAYWQFITLSLETTFQFEVRSQNPAKDAFNAALNYLYGILYTKVESAIYTAGLDATLGIFHTDQYQKPTLAFDLIEPFRPWADRFLMELCWQGEMELNFFDKNTDSVKLNKKGKGLLIPSFLNFMEGKTTFNNQICTRNTHISRLAGALSIQLLKL
jgi:CRISPR-associated protein Cas1